MTPLLSIASREYVSMFRLPIGWVVMALYLLLTGVVFAAGSLRPGDPASLRGLFTLSDWLLLFVAPAISMRLISDERRQGSIEWLMTAPISDWQIVTGKYLGAALFLLTLLAPTLVYVGVLEWLSSPDYGPILAGYMGLIMTGLVYLAVGIVCSALTASQVVAFLATVFALLIWRMGTTFGAAALGAPWDAWLYPLSLDIRTQDFARGIIDTAHVVVMLAASAWLVTVAVCVVESRRWR